MLYGNCSLLVAFLIVRTARTEQASIREVLNTRESGTKWGRPPSDVLMKPRSSKGLAKTRAGVYSTSRKLRIQVCGDRKGESCHEGLGEVPLGFGR
jgi:hypothetical protein